MLGFGLIDVYTCNLFKLSYHFLFFFPSKKVTIHAHRTHHKKSINVSKKEKWNKA